jgi:hemin uptake protein HemP
MRPETERNDHLRDQPSTDRRGDTRAAAIDSRTLFGNAELLHIDHQGLTYTLRKTRNGKLILTK